MNKHVCAAIMSVLMSSLAEAKPRQVASQTCCNASNPTNTTCCLGQWQGPFPLGLSCADAADCEPFPCETDEITNAALIPAGSWTINGQSYGLAGKVLLWTSCAHVGYTTHIWDPANPDVAPTVHPDILHKITSGGASPPVPGFYNSPFCSGHAWILDANKNPKLLTVGGQDIYPFENGSPCQGSGLFACGLNKVYWFDPLSADPDSAWSDEPDDLEDGRWYPSVTTYLSPSGTQFLPLVVGGSWRTDEGCGGGTIPYQHSNWWTLTGPSSTWESQDEPSFLWQTYPRTFLLSNANVLTAGSAIICEQPMPGGTQRYGGRPVRTLHTSGIPQTLTEDANLDPNPSEANPTVGGWLYANGVILHTLHDHIYDEVDPLSHYDLDRVLMSGGAVEVFDDTDTTLPYTGVGPQPYTLELHNGTWRTKSGPPTPRYNGNWVVLPNRTILAIGGTNNTSSGATIYFPDAECFDPEGPLDLGFWKELAGRPDDIGQTEPAARAYHHIALLLPDGAVAMMGGRTPPLQLTRPDSSVEVYKPGYFFESSRLRITSVPNPDIHYDNHFCISVDKPNKVSYACLVGISSITHHFDYGQRYIELLTTTNLTGCTSGGNLKVFVPPLKTLAPEGYYLLFVVEERNGTRIPSRGVFVKLY